MKNAFTLIELMAVIVMLGILAAISFPIYNSLMLDSKNNLYDIQITNIIDASKKMAIDDSSLLVETGSTCLSLDDILRSGYLNKKEVQDPRSNNPLTGSVTITYDSTTDKYNYIYSADSCSN